MDEMQGEKRLSFRDYLQVLWRRRWIVVCTVIVAVGASIAYSVLTTPEYGATAQLELTPQLSSTVQEANNPASSTSATIVDVPTDIQIMESSTVRDAVQKHVINAPKVTVSQVGTTNVVNVAVRSTSAQLAAKAANAYANSYIRVQQQQAIAALNTAEQIIASHISAVQSQINTVQQQLATAASKDQASLTSQLTALQTQLVGYQTQLSQYQFAASLNTGGGQLVSPASIPSKPVSPKPVLDGILAAIIGLILGIVIALILDYYDENVRTKDDLESVTKGIPTLGLIPTVGDWRSVRDPYLVTVSAPASPPSEAYRSLRTSIQFLSLDRSIKILQFTSPNAADGKTTTLANMAATMAQAGQTVAIVCCDLRRPRVHEFFGLSNAVGFTSVLLGTAELKDAIQSVPNIPGIHVLPSGPTPPNPSELLSSKRTQAILRQLAESADIVLVDSPPVLPVTDASVLATQADGVMLVTSVGTSTRRDVSRTIEMLSRVEAPIIGVALNRASESDSYAYYRYSYSAEIDYQQGSKAERKSTSARHSRARTKTHS